MAREAMQAHHALFARLYPACLKIKIHGQVHILDFWEYWQVLLSCFSPERHHLIMKHVMGFAYHKCCETALAYDVRVWMKNLELPYLFMSTHLAGKVITETWIIHGIPWSVTAWSGSLQTEKGMLHKGDIVQWDDRGDRLIGFAIGFAMTSHADTPFAAVVHACDRTPAGWIAQTLRVHVIDAVAIVGSVPYIKRDGYIMPLLHTTAR